ncbi:uncharacterized protein LOC125470649 [Pyrus x bretschneideri]|uniref:uncharacterized protein LOC125470649 n=1 Tax=Pyrus x bretschneideri TaxID=225117 RepID=UPI00202EA7FC|nr:uncharacterized protein LOC125470649 [Pyrus x bretschneideri]
MASPSESSPIRSSSPHQNPNFSSNPHSLNSYTSLTIHNIGSMMPIKLKISNYLPWRALFAPIFRRYKLFGMIDGTEIYLPSDRSLNPAFEEWLTFINCDHASIQKGSNSISVYLQQIKEIADSLHAAGASVSNCDLILATLHVIPDKFESFIDSIMLRLYSMSLDELHDLLLTKELSMARRKTVASAIEPFQDFSVQSQPLLLPTPSIFAAQSSPLQSASRYNSNRGKPTQGQFVSNQGNRNHRGNFTPHRGNWIY